MGGSPGRTQPPGRQRAPTGTASSAGGDPVLSVSVARQTPTEGREPRPGGQTLAARAGLWRLPDPDPPSPARPDAPLPGPEPHVSPDAACVLLAPRQGEHRRTPACFSPTAPGATATRMLGPRRGASGVRIVSFTDSPSTAASNFRSLLPCGGTARTRRTAASPSCRRRCPQTQQSGSHRSQDPETLAHGLCLGEPLPRLCPVSAAASPETGLCPASGGATQTRGQPPRKNVGPRHSRRPRPALRP